MKKTMNAKGQLGKTGNKPSQVSVQKGSGSTKPARGQHKGSMMAGPFGGKKPA